MPQCIYLSLSHSQDQHYTNERLCHPIDCTATHSSLMCITKIGKWFSRRLTLCTLYYIKWDTRMYIGKSRSPSACLSSTYAKADKIFGIERWCIVRVLFLWVGNIFFLYLNLIWLAVIFCQLNYNVENGKFELPNFTLCPHILYWVLVTSVSIWFPWTFLY